MNDTDEQQLLEEMELGLMRPIEHDELNGRTLYHCTNAAGFEGIIRNKELWATHFRHLNDRSELMAAEDVIRDEATKMSPKTPFQKLILDNFIVNHDARPLSEIAQIFVASVSEQRDHLPQWRGYGGSAAGYAIGINRFRLPVPNADPPDAQVALFFVKCIYDEHAYRERVRCDLTQVAVGFDVFMRAHPDANLDTFGRTAVAIAQRRIASLVPRYKVDAFVSEAEWRLVGVPMAMKHREVIRFRASANEIVPYMPIALCEDSEQIGLTEVVLGPTHDVVSGMNGARMFLKHYGYDPALVTQSRIPFRG